MGWIVGVILSMSSKMLKSEELAGLEVWLLMGEGKATMSELLGMATGIFCWQMKLL